MERHSWPGEAVKTPLKSPPAIFQRLVLIGFRGSGKTTLGKELARLLGWNYLSTDEWIEARTGCSIADFVKREGWPRFRLIEREVIRETAETRQAVIDCGGGVVEDSSNMETLAKNALVAWVDAPLEDIYHRLRGERNRPLLSAKDLRADVAENYRRREPLYHRHAQVYVNTSENPVEECCRLILEELRRASVQAGQVAGAGAGAGGRSRK